MGRIGTSPSMRATVKLLLLTMVRKSELTNATWSEINFSEALDDPLRTDEAAKSSPGVFIQAGHGHPHRFEDVLRRIAVCFARHATILTSP